jgi:hypothetical protein
LATNSPSPEISDASSNYKLRRMLLQHLLEVSARVTGGMLCNLLWGATHHDLSALVSPFWAEINDPVSTADHI